VRWLHEAVDPSFTDNTLPGGRPQGIDGPAAASAAFRTAVTDLACELSDLLVTGDKLAVRLRFTGHFSGTYNGVKGEGQRIGFIAFDIQHRSAWRSRGGRRTGHGRTAHYAQHDG
jgi:predicted ester cyclase